MVWSIAVRREVGDRVFRRFLGWGSSVVRSLVCGVGWVGL